MVTTPEQKRRLSWRRECLAIADFVAHASNELHVNKIVDARDSLMVAQRRLERLLARIAADYAPP